MSRPLHVNAFKHDAGPCPAARCTEGAL